MKNKKPTKSLHSPTSLINISFGKIGVGPDGERFIWVKIKLAGKPRKTLLRYDNITGITSPEITKLNKLGAHLISPETKREFLRELQKLGPQEPSFKVATRVGPFGNAFVLPDQVVSVTGKKVPKAFDGNLTDYLSWGRTGGTLEGWRGRCHVVE